MIYWIQGIPGTGKTTLARAVWNKMRKWKETCALIDDEILMNLETKNLKKIVKALSKDYQWIVICSVSKPRIEVDKHILLDGTVRQVSKRHSKHDNVQFQEIEYERYWVPRAAQAEPDVTIWVGQKKPEEVYEVFYQEVLKWDLK